MSGPSVLESPKSYDYFTLDGERSPGVCKIISGGHRKVKITDQQQPLTRGANTVVTLLENVVTTYGFKIWLPGHFTARDRWIAMFEEGTRRPQVRVYKHRDLNMGWVLRSILEDFGPQTPDKPGGPWDWVVTMHEYNRIAPFGGPIRPPDALDALSDKLRGVAADEQAKLANHQAVRAGAKAAKKGK